MKSPEEQERIAAYTTPDSDSVERIVGQVIFFTHVLNIL